jgi:hypothetical protein
MSIGTLQDIIIKIRRLTVSGNSNQITNSQIIDYINSFYLYDLPAYARILKLQDKYYFNTIKGIDTYAFDSEGYTTIQQPVYCMKREIKLFQDPWSFWGVNYNWQFQQNFATGSGITGPYTGTVQSTPIIRSVNNDPTSTSYPISKVQNVLITANVGLGDTENVTDDGNGGLIDPDTGAPRGTINYDTGAISVTFASAIPSGESIQIQYNPATMSIPLSILFFQNQFTLRPVPNRGYTIEMTAYRQPSQALLGTTDPDNPTFTGTPELLELWELLAFGAAKKFYEDRLDPDGVALMEKSLAERYMVAENRTYAQLGKVRAPSIYADQLTNNYGSSGWGFGQGT